jgi:uncharacterized protein YpuA (DUF1002 family)
MPRNPDARRLPPSLATRQVQVKQVEEKIRAEVETKLKAQLGLSGRLPADLKEVVDNAAVSASQQALDLSVTRLVEEAAREVARPAGFTRFDEKLKLAADSVAHIKGSSEVDKVLTERANLLAQKKQALVTAGFTDGEAMQILLADIAARGH